ncbi:MAG: protein kinase [Deltaproteobacteria bacterium]
MIGRGGVGTVYRATHVRLGRTAAIKILVPGQSADPEAVARMMREARIVNQIRHPSFVDVFDFIESDDPPCVALVMELLDGKGLDRFLAEGPITIERAVDFTTQIAHALVVLHEAGVTHRDLKPSNVFVLPDGRTLKLLDFGIAKLEHHLDDEASLTATGVFLGTPRYMAPEQVTNDGVTAASDVYALGLLLHEMCTGRRLYEGTAIAIMHNKSLGLRPPLELGDVRSIDGLEALIEDCLAFVPEARPSAAELEARLAELDLSAPPSGTIDALPLVAHSTDVHELEPEAPPTVPIAIAAPVDTKIEATPAEPPRRRWWLWGAVAMAAAIAIVAMQAAPRSSGEAPVAAASVSRVEAQPVVVPRSGTSAERRAAEPSPMGSNAVAAIRGAEIGGASDGAAANGGALAGGAWNGAAANGGATAVGAANGGASAGGASDGAAANGGATAVGAANGGASTGGASDGAAANGGASARGASDGATANGGAPTGATANGGESNRATANGARANGGAPNRGAPTGGASNGATANGGASARARAKGETANGATAKGARASGGASNGGATARAPANGARASGGASNGGAPSGRASNGVTANGGAPTGAPASGGASNGGATARAPANGAPANGARSSGAIVPREAPPPSSNRDSARSSSEKPPRLATNAPDAGAGAADVAPPSLTAVEIHTQDHEGRATKTPIYLDGALAGLSPLRTRVAEGRHVVEARPEGTRRARRSFVVRGGRSRAVRLVVCRPSDRATIAIASSPTDRPIEVDGRRVSRTPARVHVPACRKVVVAVDLGDGRVERAEVELDPGASTRRVFR